VIKGEIEDAIKEGERVAKKEIKNIKELIIADKVSGIYKL